MDPISQAAFGASLSQSFAGDKPKQFSALVIGALAGMAPDLDILIRSAGDPLLFLEFHRQFTHSLAFIPFGALLCALAFYPFARKKLSFRQVYLFSFLGYATHGLLDACTSYGTQLFWPFSDLRVAWNTVSIIDPLFTLPVIVLVVLAAYKKNARYAQMGFIYAVIFLCLGLVQKYRAEEAIYHLAQQRGHRIERMHIKPSFANRHVWKLIYEYDGRYYVDAVKLVFDTRYIMGTSIRKLNVEYDYPWLLDDAQQRRDIERFRWFSDDFLAVSPHDKNFIMDVRYSFLPNQIKSMWGIGMDRNLMEEDIDSHVSYEINSRPDRSTIERFLEMVF
ncbi:MAG TPA: metal-dependent hydrolase [Gammaproteobacteria bacterium]|nr:metal-dependent hydrolase [Gammaproteobacteria bacterium]